MANCSLERAGCKVWFGTRSNGFMEGKQISGTLKLAQGTIQTMSVLLQQTDLRDSDLVIIMHQKASRLDGLRGWAVTNNTCGMYGLRGKAQEQTDSHTESWRGKGSISEDEESQCKCFQGTVSGPGRSRVHILPILGSAMSHVRWWQLFLSLGSCKMCLKKKKLRRKKVCKRHNNKKGKTKKNILKSRTICACLKIVYAIVLFWQQTVDAEIWFDL